VWDTDEVRLQADDSGSIRFATNGNNERMRVSSGGNVGIGTSSPDSDVDVRGEDADIRLDADGVQSSVGIDFRAHDGSDPQDAAISMLNSDKLRIVDEHRGAGGNTVATFDTDSGNVNIPNGHLEVKDGNTGPLSDYIPDSALRVRGNLTLGNYRPSDDDFAAGSHLFYGVQGSANQDYLKFADSGDGPGTLSSGGGGMAISADVEPGRSLDSPSGYLSVQGIYNDGTLDMNNNDIDNVGSCSGCDLAESIDSSGGLEEGSVVALDADNANQVEASQERYDTTVVGAVSTNPVLNMGGGDGGVDIGDDTTVKNMTDGEGEVPVALAGVVPVDVNDANGAISIGDEIVASSTVGVGMRADPSDDAYTQSAVIGKAMEPLEGESGTINVLVN
jgi:hypothetical protein